VLTNRGGNMDLARWANSQTQRNNTRRTRIVNLQARIKKFILMYINYFLYWLLY